MGKIIPISEFVPIIFPNLWPARVLIWRNAQKAKKNVAQDFFSKPEMVFSRCNEFNL